MKKIRHLSNWIVRVSLGLWVLSASTTLAYAEKPLTLESCKALEADKKDAIHQGIDKDMARGPEWGQKNLGAERLREILRFIEIEELLKFRCGKFFLAERLNKKRRDRAAARRLGITIPPLPSKNPRRRVRSSSAVINAR